MLDAKWGVRIRSPLGGGGPLLAAAPGILPQVRVEPKSIHDPEAARLSPEGQRRVVLGLEEDDTHPFGYGTGAGPRLAELLGGCRALRTQHGGHRRDERGAQACRGRRRKRVLGG